MTLTTKLCVMFRGAHIFIDIVVSHVKKHEYMPNLFRARYLLRRELVVQSQKGGTFRDFCREVIA